MMGMKVKILSRISSVVFLGYGRQVVVSNVLWLPRFFEPPSLTPYPWILAYARRFELRTRRDCPLLTTRSKLEEEDEKKVTVVTPDSASSCGALSTSLNGFGYEIFFVGIFIFFIPAATVVRKENIVYCFLESLKFDRSKNRLMISPDRS